MHVFRNKKDGASGAESGKKRMMDLRSGSLSSSSSGNYFADSCSHEG